MKSYDALFILAETVREDQVDAFNDRIRGEIEKLGGAVRQVVPMGRRAFAAPLKKRASGVYVRMTFDLEPSKMASLQERFKMNEDIFRVQIVVADRPVTAETPKPSA